MSGSPVILFDGGCGLCHRWVNFVRRRDRRRTFRFAAQQSEEGQRLLSAHLLPADGGGSVVLIGSGRAYTKSAAAIGILARLGFPWSLARAANIVPEAVRDAAYDLVARNRRRWSGAAEEHCRLASPQDR